MSDRVTAPGKIMLAGEYAVLEGGRAVLMAVNRRVTATLVDDPPPPSPFVAAIADELERRGIDPGRARRLRLDSEALRDRSGTKLGLGSSAAVTVAGVALALGERPLPVDRIHDIAHRAHRNAQALAGDPGSGADVAASVHGNLIAVRRAADADAPMRVDPIELPGVVLVPVWTGVAAVTATLVAAVRASRSRAPNAYQQRMDAIADAAEALITACRERDTKGFVAAIAAAGRATRALGQHSGVELSLASHEALVEVAEALGGAAKPTGAGAGDMALAAFSDPDSAARFRERARSEGMLCPDLGVDESGVLIASDSGKVP